MPPLCELYPLPYQADPGFYFERIRREPGAVLLDSGRPGAQRGRFDVLSAWPLETFAPRDVEPGGSKTADMGSGDRETGDMESGDWETGAEFFARLRAGLNALGPAGFKTGCELPFAGGLLGYLAYDFGRRLEPLLASFSDANEDDLHLPDAGFGLYEWSLTTDHKLRSSQLVFHPACAIEKRRMLISLFSRPPESIVGAEAAPARAEAANRPTGAKDTPARAEAASVTGSAVSSDTAAFGLLGAFAPSIDRETYAEAIARIHRYIRAGDCYQVNYTQRFQAGYRGDPWTAYRALRQACPTPFSGYQNLGGDNAILSLSPERFLRLTQRRIEARPIKGTRPRGATTEDDGRLASELCNSTKDRAENLMIVDLLRNDIGRSSRIGSVRVPELFSLESYPNVHHLVSSVTAELAEGLDVFDLLAGSFPGGSITGAPKLRAMQIIDELEPHRRSLYCGSLLYVDVRGEMDSSITIRSLLAKGGRISCWGGGGIVMDSDWQAEYQESLDKVNVLLRTLEGL